MRVRSGYSFRTAVGSIDDVLRRLTEIGSPVAPLTDRNSTFGHIKWSKLCKKKGSRPIYGVELAVVPELGARKPVVDFWTFLAKDHLRPLHDLISQATSNPGKEPSILYRQAVEAKGVIKITGERTLLKYCTPEAEDLYFGLAPSTPRGLFNEASARGYNFMATSDNYYPTEQDGEFYRVTLGKRANTQTYPMWLLDQDQWLSACEHIAGSEVRKSAWQNMRDVQDQCRAQLEQATLLVPKKPATLRELCIAGAAKLGVNLDDPIYAERLDKELRLIDEKQFEDYFYIIADMINWAKERMIVGPARGSSCGSLACYLLGITAVDPIPYGLIFERFIDTTRTDLPDIDIDFSDAKRHLVFEYAEAQYGREHVARLGTVGMFKPRSALKQAGIALRIPSWLVDKVLDGVIERSGGDSRALQQLEDTLTDTEYGRKMLKEYPEVKIAGRMEGHPNNASQHAAGIVVTQSPVKDYVAVDERTKSVMCDKKDAEELNLLKIDALGLTQLSIFERTLELMGKPQKNGFLESIPLDDQAAFDVLNKGHFAGVFQYNGASLQSLTKQITINSMEEIVAITALGRPGPMASGGANSWVKRKVGSERISYPHPVFEPYLSETLGIVVYQEQVMQIGREIGDLTWEDVTALRKAMSKSLGKEYFDQFGDRWKAGAIKKGVPAESLGKLWDDLCAFGAWGFNKSHAVAYGLISYWCCWFKAHYPLEFAAATLDAEKDPYRQIQLLRELKHEGIDYKPVDIEHSIDRWVPVRKDGQAMLVGPLTAIKGIGPSTVNEITRARSAGQPIRPALAKRLEHASTEIDELFPVSAAVKRLHPDLRAINIVSEPVPIKVVQCGVNGDLVIIGVATKIAPKDENEAVNVAKRGYKVQGPSAALNLFVRDDSDEIFCKIDRFKFEQMGREIVERGKAGKALYAFKGQCPKGFRMLSVKSVKYLGDL